MPDSKPKPRWEPTLVGRRKSACTLPIRFIRLCLQHGPASSLDCFASTGQAGEKVAHLLWHCGLGAQAPVGGRLLTCPAPNGLVSGCNRDCSWADSPGAGSSRAWSNKPLLRSPRCAGELSQINRQWFGISRPQLSQEGSRGGGVAVALQFHHLHLTGLQTHRRVVADFLPAAWAGRGPPAPALLSIPTYQYPLINTHLPRRSPSPPKVGLVGKEYLGPTASGRRCQRGVLHHEGFPPYRVRLDQPLLGAFQHKPQPVQSLPPCRRG